MRTNRDYEAKLTMIADQLSDVIERRSQEIVAARDEGGYTWRRIAIAVGMTEMGVRKIYERANEQEEQG